MEIVLLCVQYIQIFHVGGKYSTLRVEYRYIALKVGIFPEADGRGKYSLLWVQYIYRYFTRRGSIFFLLHRKSLFHNCTNLFEQENIMLRPFSFYVLYHSHDGHVIKSMSCFSFRFGPE